MEKVLDDIKTLYGFKGLTDEEIQGLNGSEDYFRDVARFIEAHQSNRVNLINSVFNAG